MPNHVTNIVNFTGDKEKIAEMLEAIKDDEYGLGTIDFNKITPMPESLKITAGSQTERGLEYYKAFVDVYTLMGTRKGLDLLNIPEESEKVFLRARTDIDEETFTLGKAAYKTSCSTVFPHGTTGVLKIGVRSGMLTVSTSIHLPIHRTQTPPCRFRRHGVHLIPFSKSFQLCIQRYPLNTLGLMRISV